MADPVVTTPTSDTGQVLGTESSLSNWAGPTVTDMFGRAEALSQEGYESYGGPLTAGTSDLQDQGFGGIAGLTLPDGYGDAADMVSGAYDSAGAAGEYDPSNMTTGMWNNDYASQYMDPYLQQKLDPQLAEMQRQSQMQRIQDNAGLTKAGAFGGGRQAIMNSELNDNTARLMNETVGRGYSDAYNNAQGMFTSDMGRQFGVDRANEQSNQFGAGLGIDAIRTQLEAGRSLSDITGAELNAERNIYGDQVDAGGIQRDIESEGIAADKAQFEEERDDPYKKTEWLQSLFQGMPLETQSTQYSEPSWLSQFSSGSGGLLDLFKQIDPDGTNSSAIYDWITSMGGDASGYGGPTEEDKG